MIVSTMIQLDPLAQEIFDFLKEKEKLIISTDEELLLLEELANAIRFYRSKKKIWKIIYNAVQSYNRRKLNEVKEIPVPATEAPEKPKRPTLICTKAIYQTKDIARAALKKIRLNNERYGQSRNKTPIRSYECPNCGFYHLTSKPPNK